MIDTNQTTGASVADGDSRGLKPAARGWWGVWVFVVVVLSIGGCIQGPSALRLSRARYNEAIQRTTDEQLLLNLVRLKYRDAPLFVEVGSIQAQFVFEQSATIGGTLNENVGVNPLNPNVLNLGGKAVYTEKPTVSLTPLQGDDFVKRLLSPISLDTILLLCRSGWSIERVFRLTVHRMNGLDNASRASGPTPDEAPEYKDFVEAVRQFRALQVAGGLHIGYESRVVNLTDPMPLEAIGAADVVAAVRAGYSFRRTDDGQYVLTSSTRSPVLNIGPKSLEAPAAKRLTKLMGLGPDESRFDLKLGMTGGSGGVDAPGDGRVIMISTRSLMGTLFFLSQGIDVPERHRSAGFVTTTRDSQERVFDWGLVTGDLLRVRSQGRRPAQAAVAVPYRGQWFFIDDSDLQSKSTFSLLIQLFALQAGEAGTAGPVLTLGVGG
ncbi:MAG: hypothetical protein IID43_05590 [Planctomycetes bacterium]|nr:hypothetical protein [Planctomycetota bacterium]